MSSSTNPSTVTKKFGFSSRIYFSAHWSAITAQYSFYCLSVPSKLLLLNGYMFPELYVPNSCVPTTSQETCHQGASDKIPWFKMFLTALTIVITGPLWQVLCVCLSCTCRVCNHKTTVKMIHINQIWLSTTYSELWISQCGSAKVITASVQPWHTSCSWKRTQETKCTTQDQNTEMSALSWMLHQHDKQFIWQGEEHPLSLTGFSSAVSRTNSVFLPRNHYPLHFASCLTPFWTFLATLLDSWSLFSDPPPLLLVQRQK